MLPSRRTHGSEHHARGVAGILPRRSSTAGLGNNVVAEPLAAAQDCAQASARTRIIHECPHEAGVRLVQTDHREQPLIGVGARPQVPRPHLDSTRKLLEKVEGSARVPGIRQSEARRVSPGNDLQELLEPPGE